MKIEFEVKILEIDIGKVEQQLAALGARRLGTKLQRRYVYDLPQNGFRHRWLRLRTSSVAGPEGARLRDDCERATLCLKEISDDTIAGTRESEIRVDDFERTAALLAALGFAPKGYQENRRTSFALDDAEIEIDEWPRIPAYLEIEGKSEEAVMRTLEKLGFRKEDATSLNTIEIYERYGIHLDTIKELRF